MQDLVLLAGHSYVRRLHDSEAKELFSQTKIGNNIQVHWLYKGGACMQDLYQIINKYNWRQYKTLVLDILGNDLDRRGGSTVAHVCDEAVALVIALHGMYPDASIVLLPCMVRTTLRYSTSTIDRYNEQVGELNELLHARLHSSRYCKVWRHEKIAENGKVKKGTDFNTKHLIDGIHLHNTQYRRYGRSVRAACWTGIKLANRR